MKGKTYYLEYKIVNNRTGLLGDVASLLGLLKVNIINIASIENGYRGMLIEVQDNKLKKIINNSFSSVQDLKLTALRRPTLLDRLALKHGKKINKEKKKDCYTFHRKDLELLIDFLSGFFRRNKQGLVGFKGQPRIGKTESTIAAAIHANKHWQLLSTTLLRKITRTTIAEDILNDDSIFIIDAITTFYRSQAKHIRFIKDIMKKPLLLVIEHPEVLVREMDYKWDDFDLIIELITPESAEESEKYIHSYNSFDIG